MDSDDAPWLEGRSLAAPLAWREGSRVMMDVQCAGSRPSRICVRRARKTMFLPRSALGSVPRAAGERFLAWAARARGKVRVGVRQRSICGCSESETLRRVRECPVRLRLRHAYQIARLLLALIARPESLAKEGAKEDKLTMIMREMGGDEHQRNAVARMSRTSATPLHAVRACVRARSGGGALVRCCTAAAEPNPFEGEIIVAAWCAAVREAQLNNGRDGKTCACPPNRPRLFRFAGPSRSLPGGCGCVGPLSGDEHQQQGASARQITNCTSARDSADGSLARFCQGH